jgi:hypothetical protein
MAKRRRPVTAAELDARLRADPEFQARKRERDAALAERVARLQEEQAPIVADLKAVVSLNRLSDLIIRSAPYPAAIPILLKHLVLPYSDPTRETLARFLAVPDARYAWPIFVAEYRKAPFGYVNGIRRTGAKDGLAVALAATATDSTIDELIALAKDRSHGASRLLLLRALRRSRSDAAKQAIQELSTDPDLEKEIASWRKRKGRRLTAPKSSSLH